MQHIDFNTYQQELLAPLEASLKGIEMWPSEYSFLHGLLRFFRPKKILEVGVAAGGSSAVILNAIKDIPDAMLYSVDILPFHYMTHQKQTGYMVGELVPELKGKWYLRTGGIAAKFMDEIGPDIDFCLLDTAHFNPGEFLDFLMVLPYLKKNAILVLHDTSLQTYEDHLVTCSILLSAVNGLKLIPTITDRPFFPNIGAVILSENIMDDAWSHFNLLLLPWHEWTYLSDGDWAFLESFFGRHYRQHEQLFFRDIVKYKNGRADMIKSHQQRAQSDKKHPADIWLDWFKTTVSGAPERPHYGHNLAVTWPHDSKYFRMVNDGQIEVETTYVKECLLTELQEKNIPGDIVEFGVYRGFWLEKFCLAREELKFSKNIYGFDSFEGLPAPDPANDMPFAQGEFRTDFEAVCKGLKCEERPYLKLLKGWFADTLIAPEAQAIKEISFARIDCDLYQPAKECLEYLTDRLVDGAFLVFDDWDWSGTTGESKALAEWLPSSGLKLEFVFMGSWVHMYFRVIKE